MNLCQKINRWKISRQIVSYLKFNLLGNNEFLSKLKGSKFKLPSPTKNTPEGSENNRSSERLLVNIKQERESPVDSKCIMNPKYFYNTFDRITNL